MKRFALTAALAFAALTANAQTPMSPATPNMFPTLESCNEALSSGQVRFYEPRYFGLAVRNPPDGVNRVVVPLESDTCLEMLVVGGRRFVAQREGTLFRAQRLADGSLALYARNDCGNPVYGVVHPPPRHTAEIRPPEPEQHVEVAPVPERIPVPLQAVPRDHGGFCSSKKCRWTVAIIGGAAVGYAAWYYWPCPPGTVRR